MQGYYSPSSSMPHLTMFSVSLQIFTPVNIKMLVNLSSIDPGIKKYERQGYSCDIKKGEICQLCATPADVSVGYFGGNGNGTSYMNADQLKEGVHFVFV